MRNWFDAKEAIEFARDLAREINRLFPVTPGPRSISAKKEQKKLDGLVLRTRAFAQAHDLNVYKKAKLLNTIKWDLRDAGQGDDLINDIIALLTPLLT